MPTHKWPPPKWHKFDTVSWDIIEQMLKHIGVNVCFDNASGMKHGHHTSTVIIRTHIEHTDTDYLIRRYLISDTDLRKYIRLIYLQHIAYHSEKSEILEKILKELFPNTEETEDIVDDG